MPPSPPGSYASDMWLESCLPLTLKLVTLQPVAKALSSIILSPASVVDLFTTYTHMHWESTGAYLLGKLFPMVYVCIMHRIHDSRLTMLITISIPEKKEKLKKINHLSFSCFMIVV